VVRTPYDGHPVGSVPVGGVDDAAAAIDGAEVAARVQRETPAHERFAVLLRAADLADGRAEDIAQTVSAESGKPITEARGEAGRSGAIIRLAAYEGSHLYGSTLPLDANPGTGLDNIGFTVRQP
jgi:glyceraldehyde-3-phosphate dehydrogenase (NADP+)